MILKQHMLGAGRRRHLSGSSAIKQALLQHLHASLYVKLAPGVAGVGVIALRDIPRGVDPFATANAHLLARETAVPLTEREVRALPVAVQEHLLDFFAPMDDPRPGCSGGQPLRTAEGLVYGVHACGPTALDVSWFVNHSDAPNLEYVPAGGGTGDFNSYRTARRIQAGEELLHDYRNSFPLLHRRCAPPAASPGASFGASFGASPATGAEGATGSTRESRPAVAGGGGGAPLLGREREDRGAGLPPGGDGVLSRLRRSLQAAIAEHDAASGTLRKQLDELDSSRLEARRVEEEGAK
jgi:hypothetical protein